MRRPLMPTSLLLSLSMAALFCCAGCGDSRHSVLYAKAVGAMEGYATAMEALAKNGSSVQAATQIQEVAERMRSVSQDLASLSKLTEAQANRIRHQHGARILRAQSRMEAASKNDESPEVSTNSANGSNNVSAEDADKLLVAMISYIEATIQLDDALGFAAADAMESARDDLKSMQETQAAMKAAMTNIASATPNGAAPSSGMGGASDAPAPTFNVASNDSPSPTFNTAPNGGSGLDLGSANSSPSSSSSMEPSLGGFSSGSSGATPNLGGNPNILSSSNSPGQSRPRPRPPVGQSNQGPIQTLVYPEPYILVVRRPGRPPIYLVVQPAPIVVTTYPSGSPSSNRPPASNYTSSGSYPSTPSVSANSRPTTTPSGSSGGSSNGFGSGISGDSFSSPAHEATIREVLVAREDVVRALDIVSSKNSALSAKDTMIKSIEKLKAIARRIEKLKPLSKSEWLRLNRKYASQATSLEQQFDDATRQIERNFPSLTSIFKKPIVDLRLANEAVQKAVASVTRDNVDSSTASSTEPRKPAASGNKPKGASSSSSGGKIDEEFSGFSSGS